MSSRQTLGRWGETLAANFLIDKGYTIIERNWRTPYGEIDLVAKIGETIVFVEVKTRANDRYGYPEASVTPKKRTHLMEAAQAFIQNYPDPESNWRIDVIAIRKPKSSKPPEIIHFENAVN